MRICTGTISKETVDGQSTLHPYLLQCRHRLCLRRLRKVLARLPGNLNNAACTPNQLEVACSHAVKQARPHDMQRDKTGVT